MHIPKRRRIRAVDPQAAGKLLARFLPVRRVHVLKRQKQMCLYKVRMVGKHLFQLNPRQILAVLITVAERLIIFPAHLCKLFQLRRTLLHCVDVIIRDIFLRAKVFTDDPFTQRRNGLAHFKINQSQEVSRLDMIFVEFLRQLQALDRPGKIPDTGFIQLVIIIVIGNAQKLLISRNICPAVRAEILFCQICSTIITLHIFAPLLFLPGGIGHFFFLLFDHVYQNIRKVCHIVVYNHILRLIDFKAGMELFQFFFKVDSTDL